MSIKAPKGYQVSFEKNRQFVYWLKEQGFNVKGTSSDTFQSADTGQQLIARGFNHATISVDRVDSDRICKPYQYLRSTIYEERIEMYDSTLLTEELLGLERDNNSGKIDHSPNGINSKDAADAVCGSLWNASLHADEYDFDYGDTLETITQVSSNTGNMDKRQVIVDFEEELKKISDPLTTHIIQKKKEENNFMDFGLGRATTNFNAGFLQNGIVVW